MDRVLLGLSGLDIELARILVEAARDAIFLNNKPRLGVQLLARPRSWASLWHPHHGRRFGDAELATLSDIYFYFGLGGSLTSSLPATEAVMNSMWNAELVARQMNDDELKYQRGSNALVVAGNESRKIEQFDNALAYLSEARKWSGRAGLARREAESLGLLAYTYAHVGDRGQYRAALDAAGEALAASNEGTGPDPTESIFSEASLAEAELRCTVIAGTTAELRAACTRLRLPVTSDKHWTLYYANTAAQALAKVRDPDATDWIEYVVREGVAMDARGQLLKALITLEQMHTERAAALKETVAAYLQPE